MMMMMMIIIIIILFNSLTDLFFIPVPILPSLSPDSINTNLHIYLSLAYSTLLVAG